MANSIFQMGSCASSNRQLPKQKQTIETTVVHSFRSSKNCTFKVKLKPIQPTKKDDVVEDVPTISEDILGFEAAGLRSEDPLFPPNMQNSDKKVSFVQMRDFRNLRSKPKLISSKSQDISCDSMEEQGGSQSKSIFACVPLQQFIDELFHNLEKLCGKTPTDDGIIKTAVGIKPVKLQKVELMDGSVYEGECQNGRREGYGTQLWLDGTTYEGGWRDNQVYGYGVLRRPNGDYYQGYWKDNCFQGKGTNFDSVTGCKFMGIWQKGRLEGKGSEDWSDGAHFEGLYKNGKKSGNGKLTFTDGTYYQGSFHENEIHGFGKYCWVNSRTYEGEWVRNQMHGRGKIVYNNGTYYQGEFFNDKRQGHGVYAWADGRKYIGNWEKGKQHGRGVMYTAKGQKREGQWCQGKRVLEVTR